MHAGSITVNGNQVDSKLGPYFVDARSDAAVVFTVENTAKAGTANLWVRGTFTKQWAPTIDLTKLVLTGPIEPPQDLLPDQKIELGALKNTHFRLRSQSQEYPE